MAWGCTILALLISISSLVPKAAAQSDKYPKMAPVGQYLMERNAEILLAPSAAPDSISSDATVLILGRQGYETAVEGRNGWVCMVERGWMGMFDWPEVLEPEGESHRLSEPPAARSILPIADLRARMVMAGRSKAEIVSAIKAAFQNKQLPNLESGAMAYMMKSAYLTDEGDHNGPHPMFFTPVKDSKDWSSGAVRSPVVSCPYWFISTKGQSQLKGLPPILVFLVWLQIGPAERPHPRIKNRWTTTQSRHPTEVRQRNPSGLPRELSARRTLCRNGVVGHRASAVVC